MAHLAQNLENKMANAIFCYDVTVWCDKKDKAQTVDLFDEYAKHWVFQQEMCPSTGRLHYQCRISLKTKKRLNELIKSWNSIGWSGCYDLTITSSGASTNFDYVMKTETRLDGPWSDKDPKPAYIPKQVRDRELLGWQKQVFEDVGKWDERHVNLIINKSGNVGKTILCTWMMAHGHAEVVPPCNSYEDLMKMVMGMPETGMYLIDVPRGIDCGDKEKRGLWAAIESIKNGYCWDNRYEWKRKLMDCPNIWVFTNHQPDMTVLSKDRWILWEIENEADWKNSKLVRVEPKIPTKEDEDMAEERGWTIKWEKDRRKKRLIEKLEANNE